MHDLRQITTVLTEPSAGRNAELSVAVIGDDRRLEKWPKTSERI